MDSFLEEIKRYVELYPRTHTPDPVPGSRPCGRLGILVLVSQSNAALSKSYLALLCSSRTIRDRAGRFVLVCIYGLSFSINPL